jgi:hypothetical protein
MTTTIDAPPTTDTNALAIVVARVIRDAAAAEGETRRSEADAIAALLAEPAAWLDWPPDDRDDLEDEVYEWASDAEACDVPRLSAMLAVRPLAKVDAELHRWATRAIIAAYDGPTPIVPPSGPLVEL